jgi:hypothetical protein
VVTVLGAARALRAGALLKPEDITTIALPAGPLQTTTSCSRIAFT